MEKYQEKKIPRKAFTCNIIMRDLKTEKKPKNNQQQQREKEHQLNSYSF